MARKVRKETERKQTEGQGKTLNESLPQSSIICRDESLNVEDGERKVFL